MKSVGYLFQRFDQNFFGSGSIPLDVLTWLAKRYALLNAKNTLRCSECQTHIFGSCSSFEKNLSIDIFEYRCLLRICGDLLK